MKEFEQMDDITKALFLAILLNFPGVNLEPKIDAYQDDLLGYGADQT